MLKRHVLKFEQLQGGRCADVRRFCNFMMHNQNMLVGGVGTPDRMLENNESSDESTVDTLENQETNDQYEARTGRQVPQLSPQRPGPPLNSPNSQWNTPETQPNTGTQTRSRSRINDLHNTGMEHDLFPETSTQTTNPNLHESSIQNTSIKSENHNPPIAPEIPHSSNVLNEPQTNMSTQPSAKHSPQSINNQQHTSNAVPSPPVFNQSPSPKKDQFEDFASYVQSVKRKARALQNKPHTLKKRSNLDYLE